MPSTYTSGRALRLARPFDFWKGESAKHSILLINGLIVAQRTRHAPRFSCPCSFFAIRAGGFYTFPRFASFAGFRSLACALRLVFSFQSSRRQRFGLCSPSALFIGRLVIYTAYKRGAFRIRFFIRFSTIKYKRRFNRLQGLF